LFFEGSAGYYIPDKILTVRGKGKQKEYRVTWKGWNDRSWEPASDFEASNPDLVADFLEQQKAKRRGRR
jgi:hypothetical protein